MMFKTHIVLSLLVSLLLYPFFEMNEGAYLLLFLFAALLPDIDSSSSLIGKHVPFMGWLFRHRGVWHSAWMPLAAVLLLYPFSIQIAALIALGYLTHILADSLTHEGVRPLHPLPWRLRGFIRTNSFAEHMIFLVCLVSGFYLLLR
jgi:inner membrane protein